MQWEVVIAAGLALVGSLVGSILANRRSTGLITYRLEQLEDEVAKHNNLIDRMYCVEGKVGVLESEVKTLKERK